LFLLSSNLTTFKKLDKEQEEKEGEWGGEKEEEK
jgi:hypothetical protein